MTPKAERIQLMSCQDLSERLQSANQSQSACADVIHHSFDCQFHLTVQSYVPLGEFLLTEGAQPG